MLQLVHRRWKTPLHISYYNKNKLLDHTFIDTSPAAYLSFIYFLPNLLFPCICLGFPDIYPHKLCNPTGADCSINPPSPHKHTHTFSLPPSGFLFLLLWPFLICMEAAVGSTDLKWFLMRIIHSLHSQRRSTRSSSVLFLQKRNKQQRLIVRNLWNAVKAGDYWSPSQTRRPLVLIKMIFQHACCLYWYVPFIYLELFYCCFLVKSLQFSV